MNAPQELKGPDLAAGIDVSSLDESEPLLGHAAGEPIVLVRRAGEVCAVGAVCTHYGGPLSEGIVEGNTIRCPWHHARFDLRTGAAARPGREAIACYRVERQGARIRIGERIESPPPAPAAGPQNVVIVGAGAAGNACAEELRRQGYANAITMIGSEGTASFMPRQSSRPLIPGKRKSRMTSDGGAALPALGDFDGGFDSAQFEQRWGRAQLHFRVCDRGSPGQDR